MNFDMDFSNCRIAVIGDGALDFYYSSKQSSEISVETGLPVNYITGYSCGAGGAGNLAVNIAVLGAKCDIYGACGNDMWANILKSSLEKYGVNTDGFVGDDGFDTFVYHKIYDESDSELPRYDLGAENVYSERHLDRIIGKLEEKLNEYDAVVVNSQFSNTLHTPYFVEKLSGLLSGIKVPVWVDSRMELSYPNCSYKMNISEARNHTGAEAPEDCAVLLWETYKKTSANPEVVITLGADGAIGYDGDEISKVPGINAIWTVDTVGAGDAFLSGLVCARALGKTLEDSIVYANASAAISTKTLRGTGHPRREEIEQLLSDPDYRFNPRPAGDIRLANYLEGTEIEIINHEAAKYGRPDIAIFDHDGTVSTIRHGWEKIMRSVMMEAITGECYSSLSAEKISAIYADIDTMIEKTTGIQTIVQMQMLVDMVRRFGMVPEKDIKTASEYKKIYNIALNRAVDAKYERIARGINDSSDYTMKGSLEFIKSLGEAGIKVFLASGTDLVDVRKETDAFGTSELFTGGIFGSVGDISNDPKKMVMRNIIGSIRSENGGLPVRAVVFGDGPVEIREGKKNGFLTVGVLSDENRRFGLNLAKRERLVLAGADILIPDFSWMGILKKYLGWDF